MITFIKPGEARPGHAVTVKNNIGTFQKGERLLIQIQKMTGRIYKPGKDLQGKFIDKEGVPDNRFMVFNKDYYAVVTEEQLHSSFDED